MNTTASDTAGIGRAMAALSAVLISTAAMGQEGASTRTSMIEEIIVTAQKRQQDLQDISISASVFTGEARDTIGIETLQDIANLTPGMTVSQDKVNIRGIGRLVETLGNDPGVALYTDGFYSLGGRQDYLRSSLFVERTEVLRGPQGTLYGRNSIGGAVNIISKRPTDELSGEVRIGLADYERASVEAAVSGPINDKLRYRLAGSYFDQDEGYFNNVSGGPDEGGNGDGTSIDAQLEWDVTDDLQFWLRLTHDRAEIHARRLVELAPYDSTTTILNNVNPFSYGFEGENPALRDRRDFRGDTHAVDDSGLDRAIFRAQWSTSAFDVVYVGGYSDSFSDRLGDQDKSDRAGFYYLPPVSLFTGMGVPAGTPGAVFTSTQSEIILDRQVEYYSNEINLVSNGDGPLQWILGAYQYHEDSSFPLTVNDVNQPGLLNACSVFFTPDIICIGPAAPNPDTNSFRLVSEQQTDSYAVFGQLDYEFSDQLRGTLGLRYTRDEKEGDEGLRITSFNLQTNDTVNLFGLGSLPPMAATDLTVFSFSATPGVTINPVTGIAERSVSDSWNGVSGTLGLEWAPTDGAIYFLRYSRGYKSGGFNLGGLTTPVDEETVDAYEFGFKRDFSDRFRLNGALFYYDYENLQTTQDVCLLNTCLSQREIFVNLTEAETWGVELESTLVLTEQLRLLANYTYLDATIGKQDELFYNTSTELPEDVEGNQVPNSTPNKVSVTAMYEMNLFEGSLTLAGTYVWRDDTEYAIFDSPGTTAPSYDQVDLRATWTDDNDRYRVIAFVRNALDDEGYDEAIAGPPPANSRQLALTPPRTFGAELQVKF